MTTEAGRAIIFDCEHCGETQFASYTLEQEWYVDRMVMADNIDCEFCGKENHVIEEL